MKTIGIVGSRRRDGKEDFDLCEKAFLALYEDGDQIVSGGCHKGGDRFAEILAKKHQVPIMIYYAQWNKLGKRAGKTRNTDIANDADVIIAVVAADRKGGTEDTVAKVLMMNKPIVFVNVDGLYGLEDALDNQTDGQREEIDPLEIGG